MVKLIKKVVIDERPKSPVKKVQPLKHMMTLKKTSDLRKQMEMKIDQLQMNTMKK